MVDLYQQIFFTSIAAGFCILHFILYYYNRHLKSNLYFALFLFFYAMVIFFDFQSSLTEYPESWIYLRFHRGVSPFSSGMILLFSYTIFDHHIPKHFWLIGAGLIVSGLLAALEPMYNFLFLQIFQLIAAGETVRIYTLAIKMRKPGAWYISTGFSFLLLFSLYDLFMDFGWIDAVFDIYNGYPFGFFFLIIFTSAYLAKDYAGIISHIRSQEKEKREVEIRHRILQVEDERKSKELDEARDLQLSMLPKCVPELNDLDVCFDMRPATEVGGDYYDYLIDKDKGLVLAIGDATGHGMRAGIMVSVIKSLFITQAGRLPMTEFFNHCSQTIRQMNFKNLFMSLLLVRIKGHSLSASSAGMPPILIYHAGNGEIEELVTKGMPLGAVESYAYQTVETRIETGDVILLMSDGFPELFNDRGEMFEDFRIKDILKKSGGQRAGDIIRHLLTAGDDWRNGRKLHDDISLVVIKKKD